MENFKIDDAPRRGQENISLDDNWKPGQEKLDLTPVVLRVRGKRISSMEEIRNLISGEMSRLADQAGMETFDEANDFDVDDETFDPQTPWEEYGDRQAEEEYRMARNRHLEAQTLKRYRASRPRPDNQSSPAAAPAASASAGGVQPPAAPPAPNAGNSGST